MGDEGAEEQRNNSNGCCGQSHSTRCCCKKMLLLGLESTGFELQSCGFIDAEHDIHVLYRLSHSTL